MPSGTKTPTIGTRSNLLPSGTRGKRPGLVSMTVGFGLLVVCLVGLFTSPSGHVAGLWCVGMMLVLLFLSVPVALALAIPSLVGIYAISGTAAAVNVISTSPYESVSNWSLSVLPMFIFMGMVLTASGMTTKIYRATERWFAWLPGGIGVGTTAAGAGLASVSGSTIGMTYALGRAGIPEMLKAGYDKRMAVGIVIVSGLPGNLIPPSILLVVYAGIASVPVGPQLMAGAVPGLLIALLFAVFIMVLGTLRPSLVGRGQGRAEAEVVTWRMRFQSLGDVWGFPLIMFVLFGGIFSGVFTPTEAGAGAALVSLVLLMFYARKEKPLQKLTKAAFETVASTAAIFFIIIGAEMLTKLMAITGLAQMITGSITDLGLPRWGFLMMLVVMYVFLGMFLDTLSMMLLTIPILLPTIGAMGVSSLWFGVFVVLLGELAMITPPVGILSYIVHNITKSSEVNVGHDITLKDIFTSLLWFLPIVVLFLIIMIAVPEMTEWLPDLLEKTAGGAATA